MIDTNRFKGLSVKELMDIAVVVEKELKAKGAPYTVACKESSLNTLCHPLNFYNEDLGILKHVVASVAVDYNNQAKEASRKDVEGDPLKTQVAGTHYKDMKIQPLEYCHANNIGKIEGDVIAYVSRWKLKGGIQDLEKAIHELQILIQLEQQKP